MRLSIVRDNRDRGGRSNSRVNASKAIVLEPFVRLTGSRVGFTSRTSPKTDSASTNTCKHLPPLLKRVLFLSSIMGYKGANLPANSPECFFFFLFSYTNTLNILLFTRGKIFYTILDRFDSRNFYLLRVRSNITKQRIQNIFIFLCKILRDPTISKKKRTIHLMKFRVVDKISFV